MPELRISGMGKFAARDEFVAESTFGTQREVILRGFSVDEETRTAGRSSGSDGADAAAFFANHEEKGKIARAAGEKRFRCNNHRSDDALGVTGAAAVDVGTVFARGEKGGNGVHVRGERDVRIT